MKLCEAFYKRLQQLIKGRYKSVYEFCIQNGIARSTIENLMKGNSKSPKLSTVYEVASALGMSPLEFLDSEIFLPDNIEID